MIVLISFLPLCIETSHKKINIIEKKVIIYSVLGIGMSKMLANGRQKTVKRKEMSVYLSAALPQAILDPHLSYLPLTSPTYCHRCCCCGTSQQSLWYGIEIWTPSSPIPSSLLTLHINGFQSTINQSYKLFFFSISANLLYWFSKGSSWLLDKI